MHLDTGYDQQKESLSKVEGLNNANTDNSSTLLEAFLPISNEERTPDFTFLNEVGKSSSKKGILDEEQQDSSSFQKQPLASK
jgi:hypothetical protein